jgi:hypothetical protein
MRLRAWMEIPIRSAAKMGFFSKDVWDKILPPTKKPWRYEQWRTLIGSGLFKNSPRYTGEYRLIVLTEKGRSIASDLALNPVDPPGGEFVSHDELILEYVLRLHESGLIESWSSEAEIKRDDYKYSKDADGKKQKLKYPDLVVRLNVPGTPVYVAVEFEKTRKNSSRYNDFVNKYRGRQNIDSVVILCKNQGIVAAIRRAQVRTSYPQKIRPMVFGIIDDVMKSPGQGKLDLDGKTLTIENTVKSLREKRKSILTIKPANNHTNDHTKNGNKGYQ